MNPFNVLEIPSDATAEDIKAAYHRLAKRWHPDRYTGPEKEEAESKFRELAEAFSMLKDPANRLALQQQQPKIQPAMTVTAPEPAQERTSDDWAEMAKIAFTEGKTDQARALIHYAIRLDGQKSKYHALMATILEKEGGDPRAVVKALESAVRLAPGDVEIHIRLAGYFQALGMAARAQRHLEAAREISPNHPKLRAPSGKGVKGSKGQAAAHQQQKISDPPKGILDQVLDLWSRLTGKG